MTTSKGKKDFSGAINIKRPLPVQSAQPVASTHPVAALPERLDIRQIELQRITPDPEQPRKHFSSEKLQDLANSIREKGVLQPIRVKRAGGDLFQIVFGERRWRASQQANLSTMPCIVLDSDKDAAEIQLIENIHREDLTPEETALAVARALTDKQVTHEDFALHIGKPRPFVTKCARIAEFLKQPGVTAAIDKFRASGEFSLGFDRLYEAASKSTAAEGLEYLTTVVHNKLTTSAVRSKAETGRPWDHHKIVKHLKIMRGKLNTNAISAAVPAIDNNNADHIIKEFDETLLALENARREITVLKNKLLNQEER